MTQVNWSAEGVAFIFDTSFTMAAISLRRKSWESPAVNCVVCSRSSLLA